MKTGSLGSLLTFNSSFAANSTANLPSAQVTAKNLSFSYKVQERLEGMEDQAFFQLTCEDRFLPVTDVRVEWDEKSLKDAIQRAPGLASDPAKGDKITDGGIEEAAVALTAERQQIFGRATRETSGSAEFIDDRGVAWDVKSPLSPPSAGGKGTWVFSPDHQLKKVRHDLSQGDKVLFNLSRVNDKDRDDTLKLLTEELTCQERSQILILTDREVANRHA